jgi:Ca-activated chloride channel family protein
MKTLYDRGLAPLPKSSSTTKLTRVYEERYHWPLSLAILCLALEVVLPESTTSGRRKGKTAAVMAGATMLALAMTTDRAEASPSSAYRDYQKGKYVAALSEYARLADIKTNDYRLHYNAGEAAYQTKEYEKALQQFTATLDTPTVSSDLATQEHVYYDLGNTLYHLGDGLSETDKKKEQWEQAVQNYGHALQLNTNDLDAKNNLAYVQQKLEELKKQDQQQDKNKPNDTEPSEEAKKAKERADAAVKARQYKEALDIMEASLKSDPTTQYYGDYIKRLQEINGVAVAPGH